MSALTGFKRLGFAVVALLLTIFGVLGIVSLLVPAQQGNLEAFPVSTAVGNVRNNGPELLDPLPLA